jgi:hypothetical protein
MNVITQTVRDVSGGDDGGLELLRELMRVSDVIGLQTQPSTHAAL